MSRRPADVRTPLDRLLSRGSPDPLVDAWLRGLLTHGEAAGSCTAQASAAPAAGRRKGARR
jgi:hypothetical protein